MADYVTVSEVKDLLEDLQGDTSKDALITKLITRASRDIDRLTRQSFDLKTATTKVLDGSGTKTLFLPWAWPLNAITTLQVKVGGEGGALTSVPTADIFLEPVSRPLGYPARWIDLAWRPTGSVMKFDFGKGTVSITGDFGWAATPDEIKEVCIEIVIRAYRTRGAGHSEEIDVNNLGLDAVPRALSARARAILKEYGLNRPLMA